MSIDPAADTLAEPGVAKESNAARIRTAAALVGRTLKGQYRIEKELGQGAHGVVFRGTQLALQKPVAIKMLRPDGFHSDDALDRFQREATVVSKLVHPSIAQVLDFGVEESMPFLVMEFVDGKELTEITESEGPLAPARAVAIIRQLASALQEAHQHGIVHRDIKPHNIRLMRYTPGGQLFVKVLDFGIAKQIDEAQGHKLTATGAVMGTPAYMAPEQVGGQPLSARADQYATGCVLYELLTGSVPFVSQTVSGMLMAHLTQPPPELPRGVPESLRKIVMRLLAKNPAERFENCADLDRALADCESACRDVPALSKQQAAELGKSPGLPGATAQVERAPAKPTGKQSLIVGGAFVAAVLLVGGVVVLAPKRNRTPQVATPGPATQNTGGPATHPDEPKPTEAGKGTTDPGKAATSDLGAKAGAQTGGKPGDATAGGGSATPTVTANKPSAVKPSPVGTTASASPSPKEPAAVKEKLDEAEALLRKGTYDEAASIALKTTFTAPTPRAYRQLVTAYCNMGDLSRATTYFHRVAAADKRSLIALCRKHDIDLH
ncbi:MAG: protein kinase [Myxococcales bacterium]|nr:protein kinase [Myxococcales bacterium]